MNLALKLLLKCQPRQQFKSSQTTSGFTMIELLIGTIMAFLIITPLLGFVVSVLNDDTREQAKSAADFEQQAAISFISEDLGRDYYIYSNEKEKQLADGTTEIVKEIDEIKGDLPRPGEDPILVFWKQQTIPNSLPFSSDIDPKDCEPNTCDDTTVRALVSYYLIQEDSKIWCQPEGGDCPQRIIRYVMKENLEKYRGTGVGFEPGQLDQSQEGNVVFSTEFSLDDPTKNIIEREIKKATGEVLINYISDFEVSDVPPTSDSATILLQSNGKRRINADENCKNDEVSAFCPKATVTVTGLSLEIN